MGEPLGTLKALSSLSVIPGTSCMHLTLSHVPLQSGALVCTPVCLLPRSLSRFLAPGLWRTPEQCPGTPPTTMSPNWPRIFLQSTSSSCLGGFMPPFQAVLSLRAPSVSSCLLPCPVGMGSGLLAGVCAAPEKALQRLPRQQRLQPTGQAPSALLAHCKPFRGFSLAQDAARSSCLHLQSGRLQARHAVRRRSLSPSPGLNPALPLSGFVALTISPQFPPLYSSCLTGWS